MKILMSFHQTSVGGVYAEIWQRIQNELPGSLVLDLKDTFISNEHYAMIGKNYYFIS